MSRTQPRDKAPGNGRDHPLSDAQKRLARAALLNSRCALATHALSPLPQCHLLRFPGHNPQSSSSVLTLIPGVRSPSGNGCHSDAVLLVLVSHQHLVHPAPQPLAPVHIPMPHPEASRHSPAKTSLRCNVYPLTLIAPKYPLVPYGVEADTGPPRADLALGPLESVRFPSPRQPQAQQATLHSAIPSCNRLCRHAPQLHAVPDAIVPSSKRTLRAPPPEPHANLAGNLQHAHKGLHMFRDDKC